MKLVVHCRKEPYDVYVGRPTIWGNPFSHKPGTLAKFKVETREEAIERFEAWFLGRHQLVALARQVLKGKVLGCWCDPQPCHAHVLVRIANTSLSEDGASGVVVT